MNATPPKSVAYCVDTNLLIEFVALQNFPWKELDHNVDLVRIIVPTKVGEEMDEHKSKSGRLRRRAIEFGQLARRMEESEDGVVALRETDPRVTVEFGPLFRKTDLDGDRFELEDSDNRIVAEVLAIAKNVPGVALLADDSKPIRLARQAGLPYTRPLPEWRRQEGPDERDIEIVELKREIGAHPILTLSLADADEQNRLLIEDNPKAAEDACRKAFAEAAVESEPQTSREAFIKRYGLYSPGPYDLAMHLRGVSGLEESQLQGYENDYRRFVNKSQEIAKTLHVMLSAFGFTRHIDISVGNAGDRAAEKVLVKAEVQGPFRFQPTNLISKLLKSMLEAPTPPKPRTTFPSLPYGMMNLRDQSAPARIDAFHKLDEPESGGQSTLATWRCEELRQGAHFDLPLLVVTDQPEARGLLTITASSAVMAKKTVVQIPLEVRSMNEAAGPEYFLQRLIHIPKAYRNAFRVKLETLANGA